jgi:UDP-N-acetylmuramoylalanine--D-glutamate ligase
MGAPLALQGLRATIVGAAREGTALARFLARHGAIVTLGDAKPREALGGALDGLAGCGVRLALGEAQPDLEGVDVLFISPGVPPTAPVVQDARRRGIPISSEPRLFTQMVGAPVVGITGSSGKTTTTALVGEMLKRDGQKAWVGGNIGMPLIERLLEEERPDVVVMELSSFQLELFTPSYQGPGLERGRSAASRAVSATGWSPHIAAITNITPNHLDRHASMAEYAEAKAAIVAFQRPGDWAVLNADDAHTGALAVRTRAEVLQFSLSGPVPQGAYLDHERVVLRHQGRERVLCTTDAIQLRGRHNVANILAAACCAAAAGADIEAMRETAATFRGVPHRLEVVRVWRGATFVNDSIATSPERAVAALRAFDQPVILLAGGRDKHLPWEEWAEVALDRARAVVGFGEAAPLIERVLREAVARRGGLAEIALHVEESLERAVARAAALANPGDVVLLSPGGTSFDAFKDFEARGARFRELVTSFPEGA